MIATVRGVGYKLVPPGQRDASSADIDSQPVF
jgi:hypothetical protein